MPFGALGFYILSKYLHELIFENYVADMLLSAATNTAANAGRGRVKADKVKRYYDLTHPTRPEREVSKDDVKGHYARLIRK